jgi:glycosyltransferase involved in cell wall biosynthesis
LGARAKGWDVYLATRVSQYKEQIEQAGVSLIPLYHFKRGFQNPLKEVLSFLELLRIYMAVHPDLVHQVAIKPMLMGTLVARLSGIDYIVNAFAGMGSLYASESRRRSLFIKVLHGVLRVLFQTDRVRMIFQNLHDLNQLVSDKIINQKQATLIKGSGVDIQRFRPRPGADGIPRVVLPARMLRDKGVKEFVDAARQINQKQKSARFILVGSPDPENPSSIPSEQLYAWDHGGIVEYWGHCSDMASVYAGAHVVCLPSYREGFPKVLLEAGACARPVVATDTVGCKDIVIPGETGLLIPTRDSEALAQAIQTLINDPARCKRMGERARVVVSEGYTEERIVGATFDLYQSMLSAK